MTTNQKPRAVDADAEIAATPDPFNVAALRLPPSLNETAGIKKMLTTVSGAQTAQAGMDSASIPIRPIAANSPPSCSRKRASSTS